MLPEDEPEPELEPPETPTAESEPPDQPIEPPAEEEAPAEPVDAPEPEPDATVEMEEVPPPEDVPAPDDWEPSEPEVEPEPVPEMQVEEQRDGVAQSEIPDWESMLGYVGQQANDQLFDGMAIRLAESTYRQLNRVQDRFEQQMQELDIGNSY